MWSSRGGIGRRRLTSWSARSMSPRRSKAPSRATASGTPISSPAPAGSARLPRPASWPRPSTASRGPRPYPAASARSARASPAGDDVDVLEIDGASNRGIDEIRQLRQNVAVRPSRARFKIYIIDEVHMLTKEAFNALLKTLEEPPEHVKFIFARPKRTRFRSRSSRAASGSTSRGSSRRRFTSGSARSRRTRGRRRVGRAADHRDAGGRVDARQPVAARATPLDRQPTDG
jgi:hypothetical protein